MTQFVLFMFFFTGNAGSEQVFVDHSYNLTQEQCERYGTEIIEKYNESNKDSWRNSYYQCVKQ